MYDRRLKPLYLFQKTKVEIVPELPKYNAVLQEKSIYA